MAVHSPLARFLATSARSAHTRGHTLGAPGAYDLFVNLFFLGRRRTTFQSFTPVAGVQAGQRVLDVGCGTGYYARLLSDVVGPDGMVVGVDASSEMVEYASHKRGRANCQFQVTTAEALSLAADQFDVVVSSLFMHHLPADLRSTALAEMRRVLQPGGSLLIVEAQVPRARGWRLLARLHGFDRMALAIPDLEQQVSAAQFERAVSGDRPPWLRYVRAVKPTRVD